MKKRLLSLFLAICMIVGMLPASAMAVEDESQDYELRYLTFEDADYKGGTNYAGGTNWSSLIDADQYNGSLLYPSGADTAYNWYDEGNTELAHAFADEWGDHQYLGGGHAISNYNSGDITTYGNYNYQLTVYKSGVSGIATTGGGHNGSNNFAVHYGYADDSGYGGTKLQALTFGDGVARVIDHMYVNTTTYFLNCCVNGNDLTANIGENDWVKLVATGYDADGNSTGTAELYLVNGPSNIMMDWTKWDLSGLGKVAKVEFNVTGSSDNGYGFSQPAYFAYDDVAVRFETEAEAHEHSYEAVVTAPTCTEGGYTTYTCSCGDSYTADETEALGHTEETVPSQAATCTETGLTDGVKCSVCGETLTAQEEIAALGHDYVDGVCSVCGEADPDYVAVSYETVVYTNGVDGTRWPSAGYINTVTISGVKVEQYTWDGSNCYVYIAADTAADAAYTFTLTTAGTSAFLKGITINGTDCLSSKTYSANLSEGEATVAIAAKFTSNVTKTFYLKVLEKNEAPALADGVASAAEAQITAGENYSVDLSTIFTDADGDELSYTVSVSGAAAEEAASGYSFTTNIAGSYELVFTADDGKTYSELPTYTVTLTVKNSEETYDLPVTGYTEAEGLTFHAVSADGEALEFADGTVKVPVNVSTLCWTTDDGMSAIADVSAGASLNLQLTTFVVKTVSLEEDTSATVTVTDANGNTAVGSGNVYLLASGSGYTFAAAPSSDYSGSWAAKTLSDQTVSEDATATVELLLAVKSPKSITAPADADVMVYYQSANFKAAEVMPAYSVENEDGTMTYYYSCANSTGYSMGYVYRAVLGDNIVKAGYLHSVTDVTLTWDDEDASPSFRGNTNVGNYIYSGTKYYRSGDGVYLNVNGTGHLVLASGSSDEIGAFRMWEIIDSDTTNVMIEPEYHFELVSGDAVYSLTEIDANYGNNWKTITATGSGTAFLEVSYDAIHIVNGYEAGAWGGAYGQVSDYVYNASDPNQTGLIVVQTDGNAASDVSFGIASDRISWTWDAELDTYYFLGSTGSLNLTPAATSGIQSVAVSNDKGSTWTTLSETDGVYTATVVPGNNIIKVVNGNGQTAYQVVRGAQLTVSIQNQTNPDAGSEYESGDTVRLVFGGLIAPVYKMSGIYNPTGIAVKYTGTDSTAYSTNGVNYMFGVPYSYNGNDNYYTFIDVTIPTVADALTEDETYVLSGGYITVGGYSINPGVHRSMVTYNGVATNTSAGTGTTTRSVMPDIIFEVHIHSYGEPEWTWAEDYSTATAAFTCTEGDGTQSVEATVTSETTDATCTEAGKTVYTAAATLNEVEYTDTKEVEIAATGHTDEDGDRICDVCEENLNHVPTLIEGVDAELTVKIQTGMSYQLSDLEGGKIFEDADGDKLTYASYFYQKSSDGGETWGERTGFSAALHGGTDMSLANTVEGTYIYKFWANDGYGDSEDTWTLTLQVMDVVPADINFYVGRDQNYSTHSTYPILELYRTAGIDDNFFDYVGWFTNAAGETEYVYDPADYTIEDNDETDYVVIDGVKYELHDYEKIAFTNSAFDASNETATASGTVVDNYNMFYASIETGRYSTRFYGYNAETESYDIYLGGQSMALPMETDIYGGGGDDLYFRLVSVRSNSKKIDNTYFTADDYWVEMIMPVTGSMIHSGDAYVSGNYTCYPFMSWANGNGSLYNYYAYPKDTDNYIFSQTINQTTSAGYTVVSKTATINIALTLTVTVPENGDFGLYFQYNNFNTKEMDPLGEAVVNGDGTKTLTYQVSKSNSNYTWRLTDPTGTYLTKAGWLASLTANTEKTFTFSDSTNKATHDFSNLGTTVKTRDEADIQLFASHSGFVSTTGTERIRAYRMWQLINSDTANIMIEPDFNIQVLQGNTSDISLVDGGNAEDNWLDVMPSTTDIFAVNYDAIDIYATTDTYSTHGGLFPATNPERTAVMIVTNEAAGTADASISFNGSKETSRGTEWDYNYDTWFYMDTDEAPTLDFTVSGTGDVSVSYATVITNSSLQSTLSGWTSVTADEDGYYHTDLLAFRNAGTLGGTVIIKMTDSTGTSYRLVRVAQMSVTVTNNNCPGEPATPGSSVTVSFDGLYRSVNKISGIFNPTTYYLRYTNNGTEVNGSLGQYQQMDRASITMTIPEDIEFAEGESTATYTFTNGYIYGAMYSASSPFDTMYGMTDTGVGTNFSAVSVNFVLSKLADVEVEVVQMSTFDVTVDVTDGENELTGYTFTLTDPDGNVLTPDEDGTYQDLGWGIYNYSLALAGYVRQVGTMKIGTADAEKMDENGILHWNYALVKGSEGCWDGSTTSEPEQDANGVYQISNGAELAWFAAHVNEGNAAANAVLIADIDLACYEWTPIGNSTNAFAGSFDGQGHKVFNLAINYSSAETTAPYLGLFGNVSGSSEAYASITNLNVDGNITMNFTGSGYSAISGAVVGNASYTNITNVHSSTNVTVNRSSGNWGYVGGIVGYANSSNIANCSNSGTIYGYYYAGGIAGYLTASSIMDSSNSGTVQAYSYAGGMTGYAYGASAITCCHNMGAISTYGSSYVGGIAGYNIGTTVISHCYNAGTITSALGYAGGISGYCGSTVTCCYNVGEINASGTAGGVVAYLRSATMTNTFNAGKVTGSGNYVGASTGYAYQATISNNYYLEGTYTLGVGYTSNNTGTDPVAVDAETLASAEFVASMNADLETAAFVSGDAHPLLKWQRDALEFNVTLPENNKYYSVTGEKTAVEGEEYTLTVTFEAGYQAGEDFAVKVNGETVTVSEETDYTLTYVVDAVYEDLTITVEGTIDTIPWEPVTVYFSMSHDDEYQVGKNTGTVMAMQKISVPYFDLAEYGMEDFYFSSEEYGDDGTYEGVGAPSSDLEPGTAQFAYGKITMMHLFIYATEVYYCGIDESAAGQGYLYDQNLMGTSTFYLTGSVGSSYLSQFWGLDENLNYYLNYEYPLASEGWGSTSDQILLHDGDIVTMGHFTDWNFYADPASVFNYLAAGEDTVTTTVTQGDDLTLTAYLAGASEAGDYTTAHTVITSQPEVYYVAVDALSKADVTTWTKVGTAGTDGTLTIDTAALAPGEYIFAMPGQYGAENTEAICSTPGAIIVVVEEKEVVAGDVNGDGTVTTADALLIYSACNGDAELTEEQLAAADINGDGNVTTADALLLYKSLI